MAHGKTKGSVHDKFRERVEELEKRAKEQSEHFRKHETPRPWHTPDSMKTVELLDVPNLHEPAWNRDAINANYCTSVVADSAAAAGTTGDVKSLKLQVDFMAVEERAWRLRHATPVRCAALAHGRIAGHGVANAGIFSMVKKAAENLIIAGGAGGSETGGAA
jgi:hypothetical protein